MSGDPSFITSKAPPGGNSDKKLAGICGFIGNTAHHPPRPACKPVENNYSRRMAKMAATQNGRAVSLKIRVPGFRTAIRKTKTGLQPFPLLGGEDKR